MAIAPQVNGLLVRQQQLAEAAPLVVSRDGRETLAREEGAG